MNLRDLEAKATPGPWGHDYGKTTVAGEIGGGSVIVAMTVDETDAALIAALRNAAPYLLDVVEAARIVAITPPGRLPRFAISVEAMEDAIRSLDSHLSAASERETPE